MKFLKLKNPHSIVFVVFRGEAFFHDVCFVNGLMLPWANGALAPAGMTSRKRICMNVVATDVLDVRHFVNTPVVFTRKMVELKQSDVHILDMGTGLARDVERCLVKYGQDWIYEIRRYGGTHDADPGAVGVLPERRLTSDELGEIDKLQLWNLRSEINYWTQQMLEEHS